MAGVGGVRLFEFDWEEEGMGAYSRHRISFVKDEPQFAPVGNEPERVTSAKLLGLTIVN